MNNLDLRFRLHLENPFGDRDFLWSILRQLLLHLELEQLDVALQSRWLIR